jgi:hypothetical protein
MKRKIGEIKLWRLAQFRFNNKHIFCPHLLKVGLDIDKPTCVVHKWIKKLILRAIYNILMQRKVKIYFDYDYVISITVQTYKLQFTFIQVWKFSNHTFQARKFTHLYHILSINTKRILSKFIFFSFFYII